MLTASFIHNEVTEINISSKLLLSALLQNLFHNLRTRYFYHLLAAADARAEKVEVKGTEQYCPLHDKVTTQVIRTFLP